MNTEIYIENYPLDITKDIPSLLTFAIDDVKDFASRSTTWSKTIVLPGTSNNNKLFGHIFQIGQSNLYNGAMPNVGYNFNASVSAKCIMFQNQIQVFKGVLRLMQINIDKGRAEYEVSVFGEIFSLNVALSSRLLENLDFSEYDHIYDEPQISGSWANPGGSGYYYPLIDYGNYSVDKHDWQVKTFRPSLYAKEYLDKMFAAAGFRYNSPLFNTTRFKKLIIPHNQKRLTRISTVGLDAAYDGAGGHQGISNPDDFLLLEFPDVTTLGDFTTSDNKTFTYGGATSSGTLTLRLEGEYANDFDGNLFIVVSWTGGLYFYNFPDNDYSLSPIDLTLTIPATLNPGDQLEIRLQANDIAELYGIEITWASLSLGTASSQPVLVNIGEPIIMNDILPKNIRQVDFLLSIVKLFNLYVYEDRFDTRLINIMPYVDFYPTNSLGAVDWTYKLNRDKVFKIKPLSELTAKIYEFKYKDDSDYYNDLYKKRYNEGYGSYSFDSLYEFASQKKAVEIIFSGTPLVGYTGEDKIYSTIFKRTGNDTSPVEEQMDSNIRILQTKVVTGVESWDIKNDTDVLGSYTEYPYAGHFDDPDAPSNDLNFGALKELFFILVSGGLNVTQFNVYWSPYMAEITDKDGKMLTAFFHLDAKDILELDFSRLVYIDGILYRLNKISDYNASKPADCSVQLLKVNYLIY